VDQIYFEVGGNATEATRAVYGGTPLSCKVKGCKRLKKLTPEICNIIERGYPEMVDGVDFYLSDMERKAREE